MELPESNRQGVSKRVAVAMAAMTSIGASDNFKAQIVISIVALVFIVSDTILNYFRKDVEEVKLT